MSRPVLLLLPALLGHLVLRPEVHAMTVLCLGDSITFGKSSPAEVDGGYRVTLSTLLAQTGKPVRFLGGRTDNSCGSETRLT